MKGTRAVVQDRPEVTPSRSRRGGRAITVLAALAALAMGLSACGSGQEAAATKAPASATTAPRSGPPFPARPLSKAEAYSQCMRSHGVGNFPNPANGYIVLSPTSGIDPTSPSFQAASRACVSLAPSATNSSGTSTAPASASPVTAATWRSFGQWLAARTAAGQFSGTALVAQGGHVLLQAGYGMADRRNVVANTAQTTFCIASIGKLFTAVAIAQLIEQHQLSFDDTIGRYLSGFAPAVADHVTIADLLDMTSGLDDVALGSAHPPTTLAGMMQLIEKEPLQFTPGSQFLYSNDSYIVLGAIIERVSGQSYADFIEQHIFKPAGMSHTDVSVYTPADVPGLAHGYMVAGTLKDNSNLPQVANPSGGAYSTVGDLLDFAEAVVAHRLLSPAMTDTILTPRVKSPQPGGPPVDDYTYGFAYQAINGVSFVGHNGGTPGYAGQIDIYPQSGYVVVVLTNQDQTLVPAIQKSEAILTDSDA